MATKNSPHNPRNQRNPGTWRFNIPKKSASGGASSPQKRNLAGGGGGAGQKAPRNPDTDFLAELERDLKSQRTTPGLKRGGASGSKARGGPMSGRFGKSRGGDSRRSWIKVGDQGETGTGSGRVKAKKPAKKTKIAKKPAGTKTRRGPGTAPRTVETFRNDAIEQVKLPHPKWVYVLRWIVAAVVVVGVIVGIVYGAVQAYKAVSLYGASLQTPAAKEKLAEAAKEGKTAEQSAAPSNPAKIVACLPGALTVSAKGKSAQVASGTALAFTLTLKNISAIPCTVDGSANKLGVRLTSGSQLIWDSAVCAKKSEDRPLLLGPGQSWSTTLNWSGKVTGPECNGTEVAKPGTYVAQAVKSGEVFGDRDTLLVGKP